MEFPGDSSAARAPAPSSADAQDEPPRERTRYGWPSALRLLAFLLVVGAIGFVLATGVYRRIGVEPLREMVESAGQLGPVVFILAFTFLQPLHVSAHLFMVGSALIWPPHVAFALSWLGSLTSAHLAFGAARYLGRDYVQPRLPARIKRYDQALSDAGLRSLLVLKVFFFNLPALQFALGVSRVRFRTFVLSTALGNIPTVAVDIAIGAGLVSWLG